MKEIQVLLELFKTNFVSHLVLAILSAFLLNCIISEVYVLVGAVLHGKLEA